MSQRYLSPLARTLTPYTPGEQVRGFELIKLNTNENAYPPAPGVLKAIAQAAVNLRLYPDGGSTALCEALARRQGIEREQVFVGNGSDEVLALAYLAFFTGGKLMAPDITYSFYPVYAQLFNVSYKPIPVRPDFSIDVEDLMSDGPVILANPNAPTSRALPLSDIRRLATHCHEQGALLLVDEAYIAFGGQSAVPLLEDFDNLLIVGTFSKAYALAGMRVGYALGHPALIEGLERVKNCFNSYPLDCLAQAAAQAALADEAYFDQAVGKIVATREETARDLEELGFEVQPSAANFLFVRHPAHKGLVLQQALRDRHILVRRFDAPRIADYLRISIGTAPEMARVVSVLRELV